MHQDVQTCEGKQQPRRIPVHHHGGVAGPNAEIERAAAGNQRQHGGEESPGQDQADRAQPRLSPAQQAAQTTFVQRDTTGQAGSDQIDGIGERHGDQHDGRLHVRYPDAGVWQHGIEQIEPALVRHFGCDTQPTEQGDAERGDQDPVQDDGAVIRFTTPHRRIPE